MTARAVDPTSDEETPRQARRRRLLAAEKLAQEQEGVLSRRQVYAMGITRWQVRAQVSANRWRRTGRQTLYVHTGPLTEVARLWVAVLEVGPRAAIDGATALIHAGLRTIDEPVIHLIAPKSSEPHPHPGTRVHESRRFCEADVLSNGIRRVRPPVATVHAALWARSDRQAALFVVAAVQQRIVRVGDVQDALRDLEVAATGRTTLRLPLLAMRLDEDAVFDGLATLLRSRGWEGRAAAA